MSSRTRKAATAAVVLSLTTLATGANALIPSGFAGDGYETFNVGGVDGIDVVLITPDKRIIGAGNATIATDFVYSAARYTKGGAVDASFSDDGKWLEKLSDDDNIGDAALTQGSKVLLAGTTSASGVNDFALVRLGSDGEPDPTFAGDGIVTGILGREAGFGAMTVQKNGRIVLVGRTPGDRFLVARTNSQGKLDKTFSKDGITTVDFPGGFDTANDVEVQKDGKIVVLGDTRRCTGMCSSTDFAVARLTPKGKLDKTFSKDGRVRTNVALSDAAEHLQLGPRGTIYAGGGIYGAAIRKYAVLRYTAKGKLDKSYSKDGKTTVSLLPDAGFNDMKLDGKHRIVLGGNQFSTDSDYAFARLNRKGKLDKSFSGDGRQTFDLTEGGEVVLSLAFQRVTVDGKRREYIIAGGLAPGNDQIIARLGPSGNLVK